MQRTVVSTSNAPAAVGPYSQAIRIGELVYTAGQIGLDPATTELVKVGIEAEAKRVFANLAAVAEAAGSSLAAAVRVTIYLKDFADFATVNRIMQEFFAEPYPARVTIQAAALPRGAAIEVDCILVP